MSGSVNLNDVNELAKTAKEVLPQTVSETDGALSTLVGWFNNVVLFPVRKANIIYRYRLESFENDLKTKMLEIPDNKICEPPLMICGPTLEALKYSYDEEELRKMYVNLLASSMNIDKVTKVHPAYVEIIKQLCADEAKLLTKLHPISEITYPLIDVRLNTGKGDGLKVITWFSDIGYDICEQPHNICKYLENLDRLKLIEIPPNKILIDTNEYERLFSLPAIQNSLNKNVPDNMTYVYDSLFFKLTSFGVDFIKTCVK